MSQVVLSPLKENVVVKEETDPITQPGESAQIQIANNSTETEPSALKVETTESACQTENSSIQIDGISEDDRIGVIEQIEFYFSDANLPFDKFMFYQTSPHLDPLKQSSLSPEARQKAENYGPGCSPILLQTVASFKRMRPFSSKFPTSKLAQVLKTSKTKPQLVEVFTDELNGKPAYYIRRLLKLEENDRIGASDRCVYAKGFLTDEDLEKGEPNDMQKKLEDWARQWGRVAVLRMRRDNVKKNGFQSNAKQPPPKWKNSVFVEYRHADAAEKLVYEFQKETGKPRYNGKELTSVMFKIDYLTMKAKEKGLPVPQMGGTRQASDPTIKASLGFLAGGNSTGFNAFKEMKEKLNGTNTNSQTGNNLTPKSNELEYEGNKLQLGPDGSIKDPDQLKTFRENLALGFQLKGEAPADQQKARVHFKSLKQDLSIDGIACHFVHCPRDSPNGGSVGFDQPISAEQFEKIQAKNIQAGGRDVEFRWLNNEEQRKHHLNFAARQAQSKLDHPHNRSRHPRENRGGQNFKRRDGRPQGRGGRHHGPRHHGPRDRNAERAANANHESKNDVQGTCAVAKKRDAEGNIIRSNGAPVVSADSVPEIGRAEKKIKTSP
ncbi:hypothetical protein O181_019469 [Austropuccinia psidii MF-1]|uniref:HTH La-type RNA-binding domain-containing protein n=1 Tax=Austropuccinia psidii MF-1 TaxID=1389203 RepID=A0A9Q3GUS0_9BASI|nr:hypothetical protein [Austropuccinia psidii MF-1]